MVDFRLVKCVDIGFEVNLCAVLGGARRYGEAGNAVAGRFVFRSQQADIVFVNESAVSQIIVIAVFADNAAGGAFGQRIQQILGFIGLRAVGDVVAFYGSPARILIKFDVIPAEAASRAA